MKVLQYSQGPVCVHKGCNKTGNVNTTLLQSGEGGGVPCQGANIGLDKSINQLAIKSQSSGGSLLCGY